MYEWSSKRKDTILITGHTHQPVFRSLTELEILYEKLGQAKQSQKNAEATDIQAKIDKLHLKENSTPNFAGYLDSYFNSGCCCFDDGDITGIELTEGCIRLIKWEYHQKKSTRIVLEESKLEDLKLK